MLHSLILDMGNVLLRYDPEQGPAMKKLRAEQAAREAKRREMYGE